MSREDNMLCPVSLPARQDDFQTTVMEAAFTAAREQGPVVRARFPFGSYPKGPDGWIVIGYDEAKFVLSDPRFSVEESTWYDYPRIRADQSPVGPRSFMDLDPPQHTPRKLMMSKHMTVKRVQALIPETESIVSRCLDLMEETGPPADLVHHLTQAVPPGVLCHLLGIPEEEYILIRPAATAIGSSQPKSVEEFEAAVEFLRSYFVELTARRKQEPRDDLISALITDTEGQWTEDELNDIGRIIVSAGQDTTAVAMGSIFQWLVNNHASYRLLRQDPSLIPSAVEEFLRLLPVGLSGAGHTRIAMEDVEVGSVQFKRGDPVLPIVHAGNLDPAVYQCPMEFKLDREGAPPHIGFGYGPHGCPGQQLARMELQTALRLTIERFPELRAAQENSDWRADMLLRGPKLLEVTW